MLKRVFGVIAFASFVALLTGAHAQTARKSAFQGTVVPDDAAALVVAADVGGDLPGYFTFSVTRNGAAVEGTWLWVNKRQNADGSVEDLGMLEGTIESVSLALADDGRAIAVNAATLRISQGTGDFKSVSNGQGTLRGSIAAGGQFSGEVSLSF